MRVDFYQLTRDPPHMVLPAIAQNILRSGARLLVVSDEKSLVILSKALWTFRDDSFLAHSIADGGEGDSAEPILLSNGITKINESKMIAICDGIWREEALNFDRTFYMFSPDQIDDARNLWRILMVQDSIELHYWKQDGRKWVEGPSKTQ